MTDKDNIGIQAKAIAEQIYLKTKLIPDIGMVLGSGWGGAADLFQQSKRIPFSSLNGMPLCGVVGHSGNFVIGKAGKKSVALVQGRFHLYEGRSEEEIVLPIRILFELGIKKVLLTNAAGGLNPAFDVGDLMLITDHINFTGKNPLVGVSPTAERPVFADMTNVYDKKAGAVVENECARLKIPIRKGIYLQVIGPSYETPAEIRAFQRLGADAVGMSTALEAIYARYLGMTVVGLSCITNKGAGLSDGAIGHEEVIDQTMRRQESFAKLAEALAERI